MGKFSRDKGSRGEREIVHKLGGAARRVLRAGSGEVVDVETDFAVYQVRNKTIGGAEILRELRRLEAVAKGKHCYVAFKPGRGAWVVAESIEQHLGDHKGSEVKHG